MDIKCVLFDFDGTLADTAEGILRTEEAMLKEMGLPKPEIKFEGFRSSDPERRILNTEKIRTRTDWTPIITLDKGLEMCVASIEK